MPECDKPQQSLPRKERLGIKWRDERMKKRQQNQEAGKPQQPGLY